MSAKNPEPMYPNLNPWELEPHYSRHVSAMTSEDLHSKAAIAEQLAWRDQTIERLKAELAPLGSLERTLIEAAVSLRIQQLANKAPANFELLKPFWAAADALIAHRAKGARFDEEKPPTPQVSRYQPEPEE